MKTKTEKRGFTLIEILLVIAIIGILAGAVFAMMGNGDDARRKSILATVKSVMPYAQECLFKKNDLTPPANTTDPSSADLICTGSQTTWPSLSGVSGCNYDDPFVSVSKYSVRCDSTAMNDFGYFCCDANSGACVVQDSPCP